MNQRRILVTAALPYANGHIHIGHLVEYLQTDMWVRFQKLRGHNCRFFCADDTHGTAIMLRAQQEGRSPEALIADMNEAHQKDFAEFNIEFDHYGSTNSAANQALCNNIWAGVREKNMVVERSVERLYDPEAGMFLADRFVKGDCPNCKAPDQYGDSCDKCGATYNATELGNPRSTHSGATPELKPSKQLFVRIEDLHEFLNEWTQNDGHLQAETANYLKGHFLSEALHDWDVSRPAPYFGFEIPDAPGNYWYVWFDAPIGYIASCKEWCEANGEDFSTWWGPAQSSNDAVEIHHFIGRDIVYFHTLFWPAMLKAAEYKLPRKVHVHGFLTVNGEKMSKSKGTFIAASTYLKHLDSAYLRYYYATKLNGKDENINLNLEEFSHKINSDLVGKLVNLASRTAKFIQGEQLDYSRIDSAGAAWQQTQALGETVAQAYEDGNFAAAMRAIMTVADTANEFIEQEKPWTLAKQPDSREQLITVCTTGLAVYWQLALYLGPVLPSLLADSAALFAIETAASLQGLNWETNVDGHTVQKFSHLMKRVDGKKIDAILEESTDASAEVAAAQAGVSQFPDSPSLDNKPVADTIAFDQFEGLDLRVAEIVTAEAIKESNKLLKLTVSLGGEERRTILAGIAKAYKPEQLTGRLVVVVANLAPRKMKFGTSEGMVIAAGGGKDSFILSPDSGAKPGMRIG